MKSLPRWRSTAGVRTVAAALILTACSPSSEEPAADASAIQLLEWADRRLAAGELNRATSGYRRALQRDSLSVSSLLGLAQVYQLQERNDPADRYRRRAFHIHYQRGLEWVSSGDPDSARARLEAAIEIIPQHPLAHLRLGELAQVAGQPNAAIAHFERAVEANPHYAESLIILAKAYTAGRLPDAAQVPFERAIEANINSLDAYLGLGQIFSDRDEWAAAVAQFEKALLIDPESGPARRGLDRARSQIQGRRSE